MLCCSALRVCVCVQRLKIADDVYRGSKRSYGGRGFYSKDLSVHVLFSFSLFFCAQQQHDDEAMNNPTTSTLLPLAVPLIIDFSSICYCSTLAQQLRCLTQHDDCCLCLERLGSDQTAAIDSTEQLIVLPCCCLHTGHDGCVSTLPPLLQLAFFVTSSDGLFVSCPRFFFFFFLPCLHCSNII